MKQKLDRKYYRGYIEEEEKKRGERKRQYTNKQKHSFYLFAPLFLRVRREEVYVCVQAFGPTIQKGKEFIFQEKLFVSFCFLFWTEG